MLEICFLSFARHRAQPYEAPPEIPENTFVGIYEVWPTLTNEEYECDFDDPDWRETAVDEADDEKLVALLDELYEEWSNNN